MTFLRPDGIDINPQSIAMSYSTFFVLVRFIFCIGLTYVLSFASVLAQSELIIEGTIYAKSTHKPLPYVTVGLRHHQVGTVSNLKGKFKLLIPAQYAQDSLSFSHVGYKVAHYHIPVAKSLTHYVLSEDSQMLQEVVVRGTTAKSIIEKALQKIPENYAQKPYISQGFYRLTTQKKQQYINVSEAVFEVYQANTTKQSQFKLKKMRAIKNEYLLQNMEMGIQPKNIIEADIVHHLKTVAWLTKKGRKRHQFVLDGILPYKGAEAYVISFDQKDGLKKAGYKGKLWIDTQNFAFIHFDYELSPKGIRYQKVGNLAERALMRMLGLRIGITKSQEQYTYQKVGKKYYLHEARSSTINTIRNKRQNYKFNAHSRMHYLATALNIDQAKPFTAKEVLRHKQWVHQQNSFYDTGYWNAYNTVLPTVDFATIAQDIAKSNKSVVTKNEIEDWLRSCPKSKVARVDSIVSYYHQKNLFNGNVLIEKEGKIVLQKSYNNALTNNQPSTSFRVGSLSKTFTSMLVMLLAEQGALKLTDTIGKSLPHYAHPHITIAQLLTHQSGIPNYTTNASYLAKIMKQPYHLADMVRQFCSDSLEFKSGTQFHYSNSGYVILSLLIEKIAQKPFGQVLKEQIFAPLAMRKTYFGQGKATVRGYLQGKPEPTYPVQNMGGAGGITSTARDLLRWSQALDSTGLVSKNRIQSMWTPRVAYTDWDAHYGYGWMIDDYMFRVSKRHKVYYHPGTDLGFYTMFLKQPDEDITIILLCNTGDFPRFEMSDLILNELNN